jgi:MerR family transcriptional regulator, thiopeptide resistance regulator
MYTITRLARLFGLSRSTLLYYDRIGILRPGSRNASGYRLYSEADRARLAAICHYRRAGLNLERIPALIEAAGESTARGVLALHLNDLGRRIDALRAQQDIVARLLVDGVFPEHPGRIDKEGLTALLQAAGLDDAQLELLHARFEATHPAAHQAFLERLGASPQDIAEIRLHARQMGDTVRALDTEREAAGLE